MLILLPASLGAAPKDKHGDVFWVHPAFDSLQVQSIAFLPAVSYDNNLKSEKAVEGQLSTALRASGYRWISSPVSREMLRSAIGDSALTVIRRDIVAKGRVDSALAPRLCRALRVTALLTARVDLFEQLQVEWNQSGKPSTTIQVRSALVDSSGRLAWSAAGSETAEGPYHDPNAATLGVKGSSLTTEPMTGQGGAPSFEEVSTRLFTRWAAHFPPYRRGDATAESPK
jgi:hypothetical protein